MTNKKLIFLILVLSLLWNCKEQSQTPISIKLHDNWKFKNKEDTLWYKAEVPGEVHSDLLKNKLIDNPFIKGNELKLQWISETNWEYKTEFSLDKNTLNKKHIDLNFEGLDTYAKVYLNDSLIFNTNNAFVYWKKEVKSLLKPENTLRVIFTKTSEIEEKQKANLGYQLPEGNRIFTRKAQFQYGWDWGPKLNTMGIWRPVTLTAWDDYKIEDLHIKQIELNNSIANLVINLKKTSNIELDKKLTYYVYVNDKLKTSSNEVFKGYTWATQIQINNPKLWWPHNLGEPYLYDIKVIVKKGNTVLDSISKKIGIRTIELVNENDSIGESFYFKVNNVPVYAKGANYIPQHSFQNQVDEKHYKKLLSDVVKSNMNMLRVWGGGIYENDIFYDLCDEKGILVWQDFMFACAMYPGDNSFLKNIEKEAIYNVKRLRNHASIALWCGNNESSEGWHRWGWQANRSNSEKEEIWNNYLKVFDSILPNTVAEFSNTDYWESSPKYGRGNPKYKLEGDAHDWWIWHDAYPFEHLEKNVPRFMSEFGFQSFPSYKAINYATQNDSLDIFSKTFSSHQKHSRGFELIKEYMERDYPIPDNSDDYIYMSQVLQAYGITKGIEAHRRAKPYNMGTLYWQLNDCWPAVSWSSIDYFGNWKALQYKAKKAFENVLISSKLENDTIKTFVVNDNLEEISGNLKLKLIDFSGNILWSSSKSIIVKSNSSQLFDELPIKKYNKNSVVLVSEFNETSSKFYLTKPKLLDLKNSKIKWQVTKSKHGFMVELKSDSLHKDVFLFTNENGHFTDNFFDLLPNTSTFIEFKTEAQELNDIKVKSLNHFIN